MYAIVVSLFVIFAFVTDAAAEVVDVPTRQTTVRLLIEVPPKATHMILLLPGGNGKVTISDSGDVDDGESNFVVRSRNSLIERGFATAVMDAPRDMPKLGGRRGEPAYAETMGDVVAYLHKHYGLPVWSHGTSRGTVGVVLTFPALVGDRRPDGVVLSSTVTKEGEKSQPSIFDGDPAKIDVPALVLHHRNDPCNVTPPGGAKRTVEALSASPRKALVYIDGGGQSARGRKCGALTSHGFIDVETDAIEAIVKFIRATD